PRVVDGFERGAEREANGARAARRARGELGHLGGDAAAEAVGLEQGERANGAGARRESRPVRLDARAERTDGAEAGDDHSPHAAPRRLTMKRARVSKEAKCAVSSSDSSSTTPNVSSMAMDSSMKSSESRPMEPSTPLGSGVVSATSAARRGSNFSRATRIVFSSSKTSLASMILPASDSGCVAHRELYGRPAPTPGTRQPGRRLPGRAGQRQREQRRGGQRAAGTVLDRPLQRPRLAAHRDVDHRRFAPGQQRTGRALDEG